MARVEKRTIPARLGWGLIVVGTLGLLLPWIFAPVLSDERYHYAAAPARMNDNVFGVLPWVINDIQWRLEAGRIAPVGALEQHVTYLLGMQFTFASGLPLFVVHGLIKGVLLAAVVGSFVLLVRQLKRRGGASLDRGTQSRMTLVFTMLLVLGITTTSPGRNGWTTFVVLCIGGIVLMFLVGAAALWVLRRWDGWGLLGRSLAGAGLLVLGIAVMLSYELHWAAIPFAVVLVASIGPARRRSRALIIGLLAGGWLAAVVATRLIIGANVRDVYPGLSVDLSGPVAKVFGLQLLNAVPGTGVPYAFHNVSGGLPDPWPFTGTGWLWGLVLGLGLVVALRGASQRPALAAVEDRQPLLLLAAALGTSSLAAAAILSVSAQSHEIVRFPGATYRGTPWIWACAAGLLAVFLVLPRERTRLTDQAVVRGLAVVALLAGVVVWPADVSEVAVARQNDGVMIWERAQSELITGSSDPVAVAHRCLIADQARTWAGSSSYRRAYLQLYAQAFVHQWHRPWCG
ncbi:hypothetical protein ACWEOW_04110 [Monashia sp. NPDC004114]